MTTCERDTRSPRAALSVPLLMPPAANVRWVEARRSRPQGPAGSCPPLACWLVASLVLLRYTLPLRIHEYTVLCAQLSGKASRLAVSVVVVPGAAANPAPADSCSSPFSLSSVTSSVGRCSAFMRALGSLSNWSL